jgi:hypothetical protein
MTTHPVDNHQKHRLLGSRDGNPILIFFAMTDQADISDLYLQ